MEIEWEQPPETAHIIGSGQKVGRYKAFAIALREHEGDWAVLPPQDDTGKERTPGSANGIAQNIRRNKVKGFDTGKWETAVEGSKVWVRFVGDAPKIQDKDEDDESTGTMDLAKLAPRVRQWARTQGMNVPDRGRLPMKVYKAWADATGYNLPVSAVQ